MNLWPTTLPRKLTPRARVVYPAPVLTPAQARLLRRDHDALRRARQVGEQAHVNQNSGVTGTWSELIFANRTDYTAVASFTAEASLLAGGGNLQPIIPANFFLLGGGGGGFGRAISIKARGVLGTTATPTYTFQVRLGTTAGSAYLSGTSVAVSAAITTASGVTNKYWELVLDLVCNTPGIGTGNTTLSGAGYVASYSGFASPFIYPLEPSTPDTATWTSTLDGAATQYLNLSVTSSASSASNTLTCKQLLCWGHN